LEKGLPLNPFPKTFKSFGKMAWKKPFFKRVSSKISARMLNLMTLPLEAGIPCGRGGFNGEDYVIDVYEWSLIESWKQEASPLYFSCSWCNVSKLKQK